MSQPADYLREIYMRGLGGEQPSIPVMMDRLEERALEMIAARSAAYIWAGAGSEETMEANRRAFHRWRIVPRMLRDVTERDLSVTIAGTTMQAPVMLAPIGAQVLVHEEAELASARGAASVGVPFIASTASHRTLEEIAMASGDGQRWFQLYWTGDDEITASMVRRAEAAGYGAIVVTVDTFIPGWKPRDLQEAWLPFVHEIGNANFFQDPVFRSALEETPEEDPGAATGRFLGIYVNPALTWERIPWLREITSLPILVKGVLHPDDARKALELGLDGIVVSNHGGRQVDGAIAALDALPPIAETVGDQMPILFDSGIRGGADIFKALALGADAVLIGRPYLWGLALEGEAGVATVLKMLLAEFDLTMALSGYTAPSELTPESLAREPS